MLIYAEPVPNRKKKRERERERGRERKEEKKRPIQRDELPSSHLGKSIKFSSEMLKENMWVKREACEKTKLVGKGWEKLTSKCS